MSLNDQDDSSAKRWFFHHLRILLGSLYDPLVFSKSPLLEWLNCSTSSNSTSLLRQRLIEAVESLKPSEATPRGVKSSRAYEILRQRYIEQQTQRKVADNIGLSTRQLQREDKIAIELLGETIWSLYDLQNRNHPFSDLIQPIAPDDTAPTEISSKKQPDLEWLRSTTLSQSTNISKEVHDVIATLKSVLKASKISVTLEPEKEIPPGTIYLQAPILRQALLNIIGTCISLIPGGKICIRTMGENHQVMIRIEANGQTSKSILLKSSERESLNFASELIKLCEGSLLIETGEPSTVLSSPETSEFIAQIILPATELYPILIVEDHPDTLELYQRHLSGSRYRFIGANNAWEGLSLAKEAYPKIIILDVMMPYKDGWSLLGQLKVHPKTQNIPVIISSILQQANLAQTLGAVEFLHKPFSRVDLLAALDRQMERLATTFS